MNNEKENNSRKYIDVYSDKFWDEQERLEQHIKTRSLSRPKTTIGSVLNWIFIYLLVSFVATVSIIYTFRITNYRWLVYLSVYIVFAFMFLKKICIKLIECYQHYAKEKTRRHTRR